MAWPDSGSLGDILIPHRHQIIVHLQAPHYLLSVGKSVQYLPTSEISLRRWNQPLALQISFPWVLARLDKMNLEDKADGYSQTAKTATAGELYFFLQHETPVEVRTPRDIGWGKEWHNFPRLSLLEIPNLLFRLQILGESVISE